MCVGVGVCWGGYLAGLVFVLTSQPVTALFVCLSEAAASRHKALVPFLSSPSAFFYSNFICDI